MKKRPSKQNLPLERSLLLQMHDLMVKSRVLEERLIKIYKSGEGYFWIGGPGEEAFGVALGLLVHKGHGVLHDYLHLHYRCTPTLVALGMPMVDSIRMMMNRQTDRCSGGRNFSNHYCFPEWNVVPVSSPIEVQYSMAIGTAHVQRRTKTDAITIVTGGDAGTAEGDFASCLVWATRPGAELPMLITVQNNRWGISTNYASQHGEECIADRGKAFGMKTASINGNDPVEAYVQLEKLMDYVREERKPVLLEAKVSRLYGHSSASGANPEEGDDCLRLFEQMLVGEGVLKKADASDIWEKYENEARQAQEMIRAEPAPSAESIGDHYFADGETGDWRKF
jgi:2-oxoisovalerate dehydrogenase E1 component alpha subunit